MSLKKGSCHLIYNARAPICRPSSITYRRKLLCSGTLPGVLPLVQHRSSSQRHRPDDAAHRPLWPRKSAHPRTQHDLDGRLRRQSEPLQRPSAATAYGAHGRLDQSTRKGNRQLTNHHPKIAKLFPPRVSKSLTCSVVNPKSRLRSAI